MTQDSHDEKRRKHMAVMDDKRADWQSEAMHQNRLLHDALTRAETAEIKLAKAVAALREIESIAVHSGGDVNGAMPFLWRDAFEQAQAEARAVLDEIKGETK